MTKTQIDSYLTKLRNQLFQKNNHRKILLNRDWAALAPDAAGVYVLIEDDEIVYVGETGNLRGRMTDLLNTYNHTVRRTIGNKFYSKEEGFVAATSRTKFPIHIEELVNSHLCNRYSAAYIEVTLGRKELEEFIDEEINPEKRLNIRGKRKTKSLVENI